MRSYKKSKKLSSSNRIYHGGSPKTSPRQKTVKSTKFISNKLKHCVPSKEPTVPRDFELTPYQTLPAEALCTKNTNGLLLVYETGSGKTLTACHTLLCEQTLL